MLVQVTVKPGSRKGPLVEAVPDGLVVYLHEKAHDGEANDGLVKLLAEYYDVAKSCVLIKTGAKSRKKVVEIIGM
jgi:uncharacterized protein YggU (UPF0235/DUF167 family)